MVQEVSKVAAIWAVEGALLVGIAYAFQELPEIDEQDWDVPLDFVATERELIDCNRTGPDHPDSPEHAA